MNSSSYSSVLMETSTNTILYEKNADELLPTASIAKVLTTITAIEYCNINDYMLVTDEVVNQVGSKIYINSGDKIRLLDLLYGVMLRSGNDAAYLTSLCIDLDSSTFVDKMNELAKEIGMENSTFENPSGLDETSINYSSAKEMAILMSYAMKNHTFKDITGTEEHVLSTYEGMRYTFYNKHKLITSGGYFTGGKTGYTKLAKRTLITTAEKDGVELVVVTFKGSDDWNDHRNLFEYGFNNFIMTKVASQGTLSSNLLNREIYIPHDIYIPINKFEVSNITTKIVIDNNNEYFIVLNNNKEIFKVNLDDSE